MEVVLVLVSLRELSGESHRIQRVLPGPDLFRKRPKSGSQHMSAPTIFVVTRNFQINLKPGTHVALAHPSLPVGLDFLTETHER